MRYFKAKFVGREKKSPFSYDDVLTNSVDCLKKTMIHLVRFVCALQINYYSWSKAGMILLKFCYLLICSKKEIRLSWRRFCTQMNPDSYLVLAHCFSHSTLFHWILFYLLIWLFYHWANTWTRLNWLNTQITYFSILAEKLLPFLSVSQCPRSCHFCHSFIWMSILFCFVFLEQTSELIWLNVSELIQDCLKS